LFTIRAKIKAIRYFFTAFASPISHFVAPLAKWGGQDLPARAVTTVGKETCPPYATTFYYLYLRRISSITSSTNYNRSSAVFPFSFTSR